MSIDVKKDTVKKVDNATDASPGMSAGTKGSKKPRADAVRNRRKVIAAAYRVFCDLGPEVSIKEVAKEAGVGLGTIYRHFPDKEALLGAVVEERFRGLVEETRTALATLKPWPAFVKMMWRMAEMMSEDRAFAGAVMSARTRPSPEEAPEKSAKRKAREELDEVLRDLAEAAKLAGELRKDVEEKDLGLLFAGVALSLGPPPQKLPPSAAQTRVPLEHSEPKPSSRPWERYLEVVLDGLRERSRGAAGES